MLEHIADGPPAAGTSPRRGSADAPLGAGCERLLLLSPPARARRAPAGRRPGAVRDRPQRLRPRALLAAHRRPGGLLAPCPGRRPARLAARHDEGSVAYRPEQAAAWRAGPSCSRRAASPRSSAWACSCAPSPARARRCAKGPLASLVLVGGYPGEWEGEHPYDAIRATGARDVYLAGWHEHDELPDYFAASDVVVLASVREQFGSALVEGMACGLPAVAVDRFGPADIVRPGPHGWLVEPDDEAALAGALAQASTTRASAGAGARPRAAT